MKQNAYLRIFLEALRTAIIFVSGFIIYELLLDAEKLFIVGIGLHFIFYYLSIKHYQKQS